MRAAPATARAGTTGRQDLRSSGTDAAISSADIVQEWVGDTGEVPLSSQASRGSVVSNPQYMAAPSALSRPTFRFPFMVKLAHGQSCRG